MLIEIPTELLFDQDLIAKFETLGYSYMSFGKGYRFDGKKEQIYHIHMCPKDNAMWEQLLFRDYLNENEDRAKAYEELKLELASKLFYQRSFVIFMFSSIIGADQSELNA